MGRATSYKTLQGVPPFLWFNIQNNLLRILAQDVGLFTDNFSHLHYDTYT